MCIRDSSKGYMKKLMAMTNDYARDNGFDLLALGGQRQRYEYYGYEPGGAMHALTITATNCRHALKDGEADAVSFAPFESQRAQMDALFSIYESGVVAGARPREDFEQICGTSVSYTHLYYAYVDEQIELVSPGTMLIEIGSAWVAQSVDFSSMAGDALFFLTDIEGNILYSQDAQNQGKSFESIAGSTLEALALADQPILFHGAEYIAEVTRCNASIWLVTLVPSMELGDDIWRMNSALFSLAALFLLLGAVLILSLIHI